MLVVEFSPDKFWGSKEIYPRNLEAWNMSSFKVENNHEWLFDCLSYKNLKGAIQKKIPCFIFQKRPSTNPFTRKMSEMLAQPIRWEWLNNWARPAILMAKCVNHDMLDTLHMEYVHCPVLLATCMCKVVFLNPKKVQLLCRIVDGSTKTVFTWTSKNTFTKTNIFYAHAKLALKWKALIGLSALMWTPITTKTWSLPLDIF